jgi:hypothetical protein
MVFELKPFMDKIAKAYLKQIAEDPETIIPPGIALYYFERSAAGYAPIIPIFEVPGTRPLTHELPRKKAYVDNVTITRVSPTGRMSTGGRGPLTVEGCGCGTCE